MTDAIREGRAGKPNVLFVGLRIPTPDRDGGSARERRVIVALLRLGCRVTFAFHGIRQPVPQGGLGSGNPALLTELGVEVIGPVADGALDDHLERRGSDYDLVLMSPYSVAERHLATVRAKARRAVVAYLALDLGHVQHFRRARVTGKVPDLQRALDAKRAEVRLAREADVTLVCSSEERNVLCSLSPGADVRLLTHAVEARRSAPGFAKRSGLLFLGNFLHLANVDAMRHFVGDAFPAVRTALPGVTLRIVGSDPRGEMRRLDVPGIEALGWVSDIDPCFDSVRAFVAPLRYGAGIKIKVLDSLAAGLPAVLSPIAAEGLNIVDGEHALVRSSPDNFAAAVIRLHEDEAIWRQLAAGGLSLVERHFSEKGMEEVLSGLLPAGATRRSP